MSSVLTDYSVSINSTQSSQYSHPHEDMYNKQWCHVSQQCSLYTEKIAERGSVFSSNSKVLRSALLFEPGVITLFAQETGPRTTMTVYITTNQPRNQPTPRSTDLLEKMTDMETVKKFHSSFFITIKRRGEPKNQLPCSDGLQGYSVLKQVMILDNTNDRSFTTIFTWFIIK